ncbi:MAG TPA: ABC transporter ATP-binding protein [Candidatus Thiothrix moscowensis]|uniref:ABC transporter ATP-binding protein n=1 Tax=unclassified Thiothrix TaxID=2636184 RepID=UPI0025F7B9F8|nr:MULTISPECIES: ABC transporter ATP-binding protein [unclassified Thiothrix]HRJ54009.1 ABC transporter ATP-binding protein [Candidatus Thiothrix moscowensis]HRJ94091.1 ABC transporter ATP-binding protein [Candidatus Thiothrix moscowensis]
MTTSTAEYTWQDLFRQALNHRKELLIANVVALLAALISVPIPLLIPLLVDEVLLHKPGWMVAGMNSLFPANWQGPVLYITALTVLTVIMRLAWLFTSVWQTREFTLISKDLTYRIRQRLLQHIETIRMSEYETLGSGTVSSRLVVDVETIDTFLGATISKFIVAVLSLVGVTAVLLWLHWQLALFILLLNPLVVLITLKLGKYIKDLKRQENSAFELFQQALTETLDTIQQIRASNRASNFFGRVADHAHEVRNHAGQFAWRSDAASRLSFTVFISGFDLFRAVSMLMVVFSDLSIGEMLAVFSYLWFMMGPVQEVLAIQYGWYGAKAALQRINTLLAMPPEPDYPHTYNPFLGKNTVSVRAENITFAYGDKPPVLKNVNLTIQSGQKIALVGASGGGKSTFVQVLLGLYQPQQGQLYFDGVPVTAIGLDVVREHVATVLQQPALFNDSIRANLTLGRDLPDEQLWDALRIAQLDDTIRAQTQGLDTIVGRQGMRLSGGQRQRLAIARMILSNPCVVILDEATSALDTATEQQLHAAMAEFLRGRTTLIVAHRLSAVRQADHIFVFEDGGISEQGSHQQLLKQDGLYRKLYGDA